MEDLYAKSNNSTTLKQHTFDVFTQIKKLSFSNSNYEDILKYSAFLHDLGKAIPHFQKQILKNKNYNWDDSIADVANIPHSIASLFFIDKIKLMEKLNEESIRIVLSNVVFHHFRDNFSGIILESNGTLKLFLETTGEKGLREIESKLKNHFKGTEIETYIAFDEKLYTAITHGSSLIGTGLILPPYVLTFLPQIIKERKENLKMHILTIGSLMRADHFSSYLETNNYNINDYPLEIPPLSKTETENKIDAYLKNKNISENEIWQKKLPINDKISILIAPTGSGKTEYALYTYTGKKTIYLLPMKVSSNAMYERLSDIFTKEKVSLLHSEAFEYLSKKYDEDPEYGGEIRTNIEMAKNLAYPFIVCTGDQIFPSIMKYPSFQKIYTTFPNSKFIIDEVQSYDPKAIAMIIKAIEEIIDYGGNVIVITATLPNFFLDELKRRFESKSFDIDPSKRVINRYNSISPTFCKHKFKLTTMSESEITEKALDLAKSGKRVMVVCNTVEYAQNIYKNIMNLKKDEKIKTFLLHSRYTFNDKRDKESTIIQEFKNPKSEDEIEPKILVSTQIIETSLDIDSDYMITEIAPIDVLIQRFGRVMRRIKEEDSFDLTEENVFIVTQNMEGKKKNTIFESSKGKVYYPEALSSTFDILKNHDSKLCEKEKQTLVSKMYAEIFNEQSKIKQEFQNALQVFDSGYSSASKLEAQSMFRQVANVDVVPENKIDDFVNELKTYKFSDYSDFKNKILNEYVISMNYFLVNQNLKEIPINGEISATIRKWLSGIKLCTNLTYDKELGAVLNKEKNKVENPFI
ncbi:MULTISPECIES: CRISPR-associated helicase/endonuclease Cas3 [Petrotoga]|uniref:CRISPR-associated Cas3 family helicase n=2 Tax=Petrotoga sibirica TaxID=156202 RepID=A0A4R8EUZ9_9BACT|nr:MULTISPECIES: CRISPR-associated helicase/endonuclease Cas3 [Petrotoga]POZ89437.1 hypothetical protein AA80_00335 [Petrotoga sibirica DSM 13575]POZ91879.1 hypothetical protein AD60_00335 [Petrotoga sp. SL27]TDX16239.1 CRISPR-associated Cas3 family helicase [Petrotoga sibirica]